MIETDYGEALEVIPFKRGSQRDDRLKLSLIRKVSPLGVFVKNRGWLPVVPNSFGLPPGETCPGKTEFCESCYAFNSIQSVGVKETLDGNYQLLQTLETKDNMTAFLVEMIERYNTFADEHGVSPENKVFRIHWSGDFYSLEYAEAWAEAIKQFPDILFWVYTRSFREPVDVIPVLDGIDNLVILLSTDEGNINDIPESYNHLQRANSAKDVVSAQPLFRPDRRTITCPENLDRLKLMQDSEGACIKCRVCFRPAVDQAVDITFITSGKYDATPRSRNAIDVAEQAVQITPHNIRPVNRERYILGTRIEYLE